MAIALWKAVGFLFVPRTKALNNEQPKLPPEKWK
jgi:hypothetical protein